ncbi:MAG: AsmA family protein, partial [Alphaproteobacteria bacterium]|nr:AsmA family protein [Alphaproteobacteria bacterium]
MRKFLIGIVVLLVVLVAAAFVAPRFIPADSLKADIAAQVRAATGRDLIIDGDLSFTILPVPGVSVAGVRMSNIAGAQADDLVRLKSAKVEVALGPLFGGNVEIERVVLVEPVFELEQLADGSNNWTFAPSETPAVSAPGVDGGAGGRESSGFGGSVQLNDLVMRDGIVVFRSPDIVERIEGINASLGAASLLGPFRAEGEVVLRGMPTNLRVAIGELQGDRAIPVNVSTGTAGAEVTFSGLLSGFPNEPRIAGDLDGRAENIADLMAAVTGQDPLAAFGDSELAIKGDLSANRSAVSLNNLSVGLGDINATGAANVAIGESPAIDMILNVGQLDLDQLLPKFQSTGSANSGDGGAPTIPSGGAAPVTAAGSAAGFVLPEGLNATIEAKAEAVRYRGGVVRQAALNAQLADGELTISQLTAQLPGSADVSLFGFVAARDGVPAFGGQGEANADDLRGLLAWLGVDVSA